MDEIQRDYPPDYWYKCSPMAGYGFASYSPSYEDKLLSYLFTHYPLLLGGMIALPLGMLYVGVCMWIDERYH